MLAQEEEPDLRDGGLGRLAASFLDSLATLEIPAMGYGIRYEFGIFEQEIVDGCQVEKTDKWLRFGTPWDIPRPEWAVEVRFGGRTESYTDEQGHFRARWLPAQTVIGIAYDTPILGYCTNTANMLRLWHAQASESFELESLAQDAGFRGRWRDIKHDNKRQLAALVLAKTGFAIDPHSRFDVQVKRIHEHKRQHLNILQSSRNYLRLKSGRDSGEAPRTFVFGGKTAPGYFMAKLSNASSRSAAPIPSASTGRACRY